MIPDDELAAIAAALAILCRPEVRASASLEGMARWKFASRNPDLELEDYRSV